MLHEPASAAQLHEGAPLEVVAWPRQFWMAPRYGNVDCDFAAAIIQISGIFPGDPTSDRVLSILFKPWHHLVVAEGVRAAVYADDRSLKVSGSSDAEAVQRDKAALAVTAAFDEAVGLSENDTKRQFWRIGERAEHLWLCQQVGGAAAGEEPSLTPPRGGWEGISAVIRRLFMLPGELDVRAGIIGACVMPKFAWAAPFIEQPPPELVTSLLRALLRTACTW